MGWVDGEDTDNHPFPVDEFVRKLKAALGDIDSSCHGYSGQVRKCCDGARNCFADLEDSLATMKLAAIGNQSMHAACRTLSESLLSVNSCIADSTLSCHWSLDTDYIINPFHATVDNLELLKDDHCNDLPPEVTTVRLTTPNTTTITFVTPPLTTLSTKEPLPETTTTAAATTNPVSRTTMTTTTTPEKTTIHMTATQLTAEQTTPDIQTNPTSGVNQTDEITLSSVTEKHTKTSQPNGKSTTLLTASSRPFSERPSTTSGTFSSTNSTLNISRQQSPNPNPETTIVIVAAVIGTLLIVALLVLFIFIRKRSRDNENTDSGDTFDSDQNRKSTLLRRLFPKSKTKQVPRAGDNDIYAEIDEAFMEAVYKCGNENTKPKKEALRERLSSNTQVNACYEATFDDNIIDSKDTIKRNSLGNQSASMVSLNPLALIRQDDDAITSFQTDQSNEAPHNLKPTLSQKSFVLSKPSFTDIRSNEPDYVYIDANEPIYAVPANEESEYDTAEYGRNPLKNITQAPENIYSSVGEYRNYDVTGAGRGYDYGDYRNIEDTGADRNYEHVQFREYRRSLSDVDVNFYENQDTMMEY